MDIVIFVIGLAIGGAIGLIIGLILYLKQFSDDMTKFQIEIAKLQAELDVLNRRKINDI